MKTVLIHIGKCGGTSIINLFATNYIKIDKVEHVNTVEYDDNCKYIILIRNPISRFISAFNWRYKLVCESNNNYQLNRFQNEKSTLEKYKTVNTLAENINEYSNNNEYIHHIKEDINFHIGDFLKKCKKENIIAVLTTETLDDDCKRFFNLNIVKSFKQNKSYDVKISNIGYENLKEYLHKDYECIEKLYKLNLITDNQYELLSC